MAKHIVPQGNGCMAKKKKKPAKRLRVHIPEDVENEVVMLCKRHCCMCFGLHGKFEVADGQLAHLGRDPSKADVEDLAYLCLECHKKYDTKNNRVVSFKPAEIKTY